MRIFLALAAACLASGIQAAPLPEVLRAARQTPAEPPRCACHEAGYPRCDCGQGSACRCVRLGESLLPLVARILWAVLPKRLSGVYEAEASDGRAVTIIVIPLREPNHYLATWHYDGRAEYQSTLRRTGAFSAVEAWRSLDQPETRGSMEWQVTAGGALIGTLAAERVE